MSHLNLQPVVFGLSAMLSMFWGVPNVLADENEQPSVGVAPSGIPPVIPPAPGQAAPAGGTPPLLPSTDGMDVFANERCNERLVFCLGIDGKPFRGADVLDDVLVEETITVKLIGLELQASDYLLALTETPNADSMTRSAVTGDKGAAKTPTNEYIVIDTKMFVVTSKMSDVRIEIRGRKNKADPFTVVNEQKIPVRHGNYYFDVGLLVPVIVQGNRQYQALTLPGSSDRVISEISEPTIATAIALNVYPFGHPKNSFRPGKTGWFGLQVGIDINVASPRQGYLGILLEPVSGVAFSGGLAVVKGMSLADNYQVGMLLQPEQTIPTRETILFRGYLGVTLSSEIVDLIRSGTTNFTAKP